jgi:hypothetical protein
MGSFFFFFFVDSKYFEFIIESEEMPSSQEEWNEGRVISGQSFWVEMEFFGYSRQSPLWLEQGTVQVSFVS